MKLGQVFAVVDIGSTKISCCIASISEEDQFDILGMGYCACFGVKSGMIVDMDLVSRSIARAVESAENAASFRIRSVYVNVSGKFVKSELVHSSINIGGRIVKQEDIERMLFHGVNKHADREVIHSIPILFEMDALTCTTDPVGMFSNVLKASVNVVTVPKIQLNNILVSLSRCHLDVLGVVYGGYASSLCVLDKENNPINQIVIDFGGELTTINFFYKGIFCGLEVVPLGGKHITKDIAYGLHVSVQNAERLKTLHGAAFVSFDDKKHMILVPIQEESDIINLQQMPRSDLNEIIQPRVEEIMRLVKEKIDSTVFKIDFADEIIITGGGSMLTGMREYVSEVLKKPVRTKRMEDYSESFGIQIGNDFATTIGMIQFALLADNTDLGHQNDSKNNKDEGFIKKTINWLEDNF